MASLEERLDMVERKIKDSQFRENKGLGNEVGYYVFDYPADKELQIRERINYMKSKNQKGSDGFELMVFDLYDMMIDMLENEGILDANFTFEKEEGLSTVVEEIGNALRFDDKENYIINKISEETPDDAVVFLIGVGKCFPILRSHKILNNLHQVLDRIPVVMFFPGKYDGQELVLFGEIKDDNYYRAFKLVD